MIELISPTIFLGILCIALLLLVAWLLTVNAAKDERISTLTMLRDNLADQAIDLNLELNKLKLFKTETIKLIKAAESKSKAKASGHEDYRIYDAVVKKCIRPGDE